jgi:precorrin-4/cobalt-precorrin-4 C11-methyltransferase
MSVNQSSGSMPTATTPKVYIVGAGPGDPDLITVKGQQLLLQADAIVYANSLIPETFFRDVKPTVELIPTADKSLEEIIAILGDRARSGKFVVRLHDGDPSLYGAIQEQMDALLAVGIDFEVIPGVSAYQLAAARLRVELTQPQLVQTIILTRMAGRIQMPSREELAGLAAHRSSLCLYLSAKNIEAAAAELLQHYPPETPVAICFRVGWPDERILLVALGEMAETTAREQLVRTTMYLISPALNAATIPAEYAGANNAQVAPRSQLYNAEYDRLFRGTGE